MSDVGEKGKSVTFNRVNFLQDGAAESRNILVYRTRLFSFDV